MRSRTCGVAQEAFAWAIVIAIVAFRCRPSPSPHPAKLPPLPAPERALEVVREAGKERRNLRALGRVTYFGEKGRVRLKAAIVVERPARFRFETISPLEQPIDVMASDGTRLWLLSNGKLSEGRASAENVAKLLPLPLEPAEVVDTLLGGVPSAHRFRAVGIAREDEGDERWLLSLEGNAGESARVSVDPVRRVVVRMELLEPGGDVRLGVTFEDFEGAGESTGELPRTIRLRMPSRDLDVHIKLKEVDVNVPLEEGLFRIVAPPGVASEPMDSP